MKYNFDEIINRKGTYSTQWDYISDRFGTDDIIPFSISDTDFRIPYEVSQAIQKAAQQPIFGYTRWNHYNFKNAIVQFFKRRHHTVINPEHIIYAPSVMYSLSTLLSLYTNEQDIVAAFSPMYTDFEDCTLIRKRQMYRVELNNIRGYYTINFELLEKALQQAKVFLLCSPHNPTGRVWKKKELDQIVLLCKKYQVPIIADEVHMDITYTNDHISIMNYQSVYDKINLVGSGSKTFNYPSLGGSYAIIPDPAIRDQFLNITKHRDFVNSANYMAITALITSYSQCDDYIDELNRYVQKNMELVASFINERCQPMHFIIPEGTYLAWIDCQDLNIDSNILWQALIDIGKTGIMKGEIYFGDHYLRMNVGCPRSKVILGLEGIERTLHYLKAKGLMK